MVVKKGEGDFSIESPTGPLLSDTLSSLLQALTLLAFCTESAEKGVKDNVPKEVAHFLRFLVRETELTACIH